MATEPARLYSLLDRANIRSKDPVMYQLLYNLIGNIVALVADQSSGSSSGGGNTDTTNITNIIQLLGDGGGSGEDGTPGARGIDGVAGATGPQGPIGIPGNDGVDGADGFPGPIGPTGANGSTGATGSQGPMGVPGNDGTDGEDGFRGPAGVDGAAGATGAIGPQGLMGIMGYDGPQGEDGFMGPPGPATLPVNATTVYNASGQIFLNGIQTAVLFNNANYDAQGMWSAGNPSRLIARTPGKYYARCQIGVPASTPGTVDFRIFKNGSDINLGGTHVTASSSITEVHSVDGIIDLLVGDYIEFYVIITALSGAANTITVANFNVGQIVQQSPQISTPGPTGLTGPMGFTGEDGGQDIMFVNSPASQLGSGLVLLYTSSPSAAATLDIVTRNAAGQSGAIFAADYDEYVIEVLNLIPATNNVDMYMRFSTDGGATYDSTSKYVNSLWVWNFSGTAVTGNAVGSPNAQMFIRNNAEISSDANYGVCGAVRVFSPAFSGYKRVQGHFSFLTGGASFNNIATGHVYQSATAVNAMRFLFSSGNITSGTVRVYGVAKS